MGIRPQANERVHARILDHGSHLLVQRLRVIAQLQHFAEHRNGMRVRADRGQGCDSGTHRIQVGVVRIVDEGECTALNRELMNVHAMRAQRTRIRQDTSHCFQVNPERQGTGCGS